MVYYECGIEMVGKKLSGSGVNHSLPSLFRIRETRRLTHIFRLCWLLAAFCGITPGWAGDMAVPVLTNVERATEVTDSVLAMWMDRQPLTPGDSVFVACYGYPDDMRLWIKGRVSHHLQQRNYQVFLNDDTLQGWRLNIWIHRLGFNYSVNARLRKHKSVLRKLSGRLTLQLVQGPSGKQIASDDIDLLNQDIVPLAGLDAIEQNGFIFGYPLRPETGGLIKKWIEPVLVIGTLGVISYLFYSIRSG